CFFFQAEDGIRDRTVTGVQTCALPICPRFPFGDLFSGGATTQSASIAHRTMATSFGSARARAPRGSQQRRSFSTSPACGPVKRRSEERRVGKECRGGWGGDE